MGTARKNLAHTRPPTQTMARSEKKIAGTSGSEEHTHTHTHTHTLMKTHLEEFKMQTLVVARKQTTS
jgi:hypothetical protein